MKKPIMIMIILLAIIIIGGGVTTYILMDKNSPEDPNNIDLILERSIETELITTSLKDGTFAQISFKLQADSPKTKDELEKRMFQINNIIINYFASKTAADLNNNDSIVTLENAIKTEINERMENGEIENIYTTSYVLQ